MEQAKLFVYLVSVFTNGAKFESDIGRIVSAGKFVNRVLHAAFNRWKVSKKIRQAIHGRVLGLTLT